MDVVADARNPQAARDAIAELFGITRSGYGILDWATVPECPPSGSVLVCSVVRRPSPRKTVAAQLR
jgi:hypothetical protein